jgi:hypothetical protein
VKAWLLPLIGLAGLASSVWAAVAPMAVRVPETRAWIGQRVGFYVELRATGSFAGTANFELPPLPGVLLMKIGSPVVSSREIEGRSWLVQTHEFALFSQTPGLLEVPEFSVHFASREGFTGPAQDTRAEVPGWQVEIRRPPGSEQVGFLVTTDALSVTETWEPPPGPARVGAMFKRTLVQRAPQISGMALAPAPIVAPEGIRVYPGDAETQDHLERGEFLGERRETMTYLLTKSGTVTLPALAYVWWNPKTEQLQSTILPAVTFEVAPAPVAAAPGTSLATCHSWAWWLTAALASGLATWQRRRLAGWGRRFRKALNPPDCVAARNLRRACRRHEAVAAEAAWNAWRNAQDTGFQPGPELQAAVLGLQRQLFGPAPAVPWRGDELARAFGEQLAAGRARSSHTPAAVLPLLNP